MKSWFTLLAILTALVCGALLFQEKRKAEAVRLQAGEVTRKREAAAAEAARQAKRSQNLQSQLREVRAETLVKSAETHGLRQQLAETQAQVSEQKKPSALFRDPEMKEALKAQAKVVASKTANALIEAGLARHLQLDETASESLKQLIAARSEIMWERIMVPMSTGELDESEIAAVSKATRQEMDANSKLMRALVGDAGYQAFEWFEKTQPDRDAVKQFAPQFEKAGVTLSRDQQEQLFTAMAEERASFNFQYDFGEAANDIERWYHNLNEERMGVYFEELAQLNDRVWQRSRAALSEEQATLLKKLTGQQLQQAKFTVRSTMALMGKSR